MTEVDPTETSRAWSALTAHRDARADVTLRELFAGDDDRGERLALAVGDLWVDISKQPVTDDTLGLLADLADERGMPGFMERMMAGEPVNSTEGRAALHTALRAPHGTTIQVDGTDVVHGVHDTLGRMADLVDRLRSGRLLGATGRPVSALVSLGTGGSYLGPAMATGALAHQAHPDLDVRFASNLDGADITAALRGLDPTTTLVLICSKTFTTAETMILAESARTWLADGVGTDVSAHLAAATTAFAISSLSLRARPTPVMRWSRLGPRRRPPRRWPPLMSSASRNGSAAGAVVPSVRSGSTGGGGRGRAMTDARAQASCSTAP